MAPAERGARPPVWGRPSPAADAPAVLRAEADAAGAAYRADGGDTGELRVRAATVAGLRHRVAGQPGEDAYAWATAGERVAVAVADGVSATPGAGAAAAIAARVACAAALEAPTEAGIRGLDAAAEALRSAGAPVGATTLVVAVVGGGGAWRAARVGDSTAYRLSSDGWDEVFAGAAGEDDLVGTATSALPAEGPLAPEEASGHLAAGDALLLFTDGVAEPLRDGPETVAPALAAELRSTPSPLSLAVLADFVRQGCLDDRTVVGVWRGDEGGPPTEG